MRRSIAAAATSAAALVLAATAAAAGPPVGVYHGVLDAATDTSTYCNAKHDEGEGYFRVKKNSAGKKGVVPVGSSAYCGGITIPKIVAPSDFTCNQLNASLGVSRIPLVNGAFDYTGKAPIGPAQATRTVHFKGHWNATTGRFVGFTRITGGGCDSGKDAWHMKKVS